MGDLTPEEKRRFGLDEVEGVNESPSSRAPWPIDEAWPKTVSCNCGANARLVGARFKTIAEYQCDKCGEQILQMGCGNP